MSQAGSVEILVVGNEILIGDIQDTNTNWICKLINSRGGYVARATMLRDIPAEIADAIRSAIVREVSVLFTSGGLGPTADDLTVAAVSEGAGLELKLDEKARQMVKDRYDELFQQGVMSQGGLNPGREKMAWLPVGAEPLHNPVGTAPGVLFKIGKTTIICLPGVPSELKGIVTTSLETFLAKTFGNGGSLTRAITVRCNDESLLEPVLSRVVPEHPRVYIKSLARTIGETPELDITLTVTGGDEGERIQFLEAAYQALRNGLTQIAIHNWDKV
jgi:nicotinamide-nucleotide amidase